MAADLLEKLVRACVSPIAARGVLDAAAETLTALASARCKITRMRSLLLAYAKDGRPTKTLGDQIEDHAFTTGLGEHVNPDATRLPGRCGWPACEQIAPCSGYDPHPPPPCPACCRPWLCRVSVRCAGAMHCGHRIGWHRCYFCDRDRRCGSDAAQFVGLESGVLFAHGAMLV